MTLIIKMISDSVRLNGVMYNINKIFEHKLAHIQTTDQVQVCISVRIELA